MSNEPTSIKDLLKRDLYEVKPLTDEEVKPICSTCEEKKTDHNEWEEVSELPKFLFLSLKRFNDKGQKVCTNIQFANSICIPVVTSEGKCILT